MNLRRLHRGLVAGAMLLLAACDHSSDPIIPPPCLWPSADPIPALKTAYQTRNYDSFAALLSAEPGAEYQFVFDTPDPQTGATSWDLATELRIHRRMFNPENVPPSDPPVPAGLWLVSIDIQLTQQGSFTERPDLYRSDANPDGLDPAAWKAMECTYGTYVLFDTQGDLDYRVDGKAKFIVIENLKETVCDPGHFLIYRWQDLGSGLLEPRRPGPSGGSSVVTARPTTWTAVKRLYS